MPARKHIVRPSYVQARPDQNLFDFEAFDLKRCCQCHQHKPMAQFHLWNKAPDGRNPRCKACRTRLEGSESFNAELARRESGLKRCRVCGLEKPFDDFHRHRTYVDGHRPYCKTCRHPDRVSDYAKNRERNRRVNKAYYWVNRKNCIAKCVQHHKAKWDYYRAYGYEWRRKNPDAVAAIGRRFRVRHRLKINHKNSMRAARKRQVTVVPIPYEQAALKMAYWGNCCWMCGGPFEAVDHVKPIAKGGPHVLANLRPACQSCNSKKSDKWPYSTAKGY